MSIETMDSSEDLEWVERCRHGDREAFARLVEKYQQWIWRHALHWAPNAQGAEELAQEVFLKAYRNLKGFAGAAKFSTWIFTILLNTARDGWRRQGRGKGKTDEFHEPNLPSPEPLSDQILAQREEGWRLRRLLDSLPEIYRETLILRYFDDLPLEEIAQLQGQSLSSIKMRVVRGLSMLRKKMSPGESHES